MVYSNGLEGALWESNQTIGGMQPQKHESRITLAIGFKESTGRKGMCERGGGVVRKEP